jgi:hypothetical protein
MLAARIAASLGLALALSTVGQAQGAGPSSARGGAPVDLTGYWVSVVTEDWLWRMMTPAVGDVASVPLNAEGRRVAEAWDWARDESAGEACRSYGAAAIMRVPGRVHVTWEDANTLRLDTDAGTQTLLFHFNRSAAPSGTPSWQGTSIAEWDLAGRGGRGVSAQDRGGSLKVVTSNLRSGYLRKNGVPYSGDASVTEYFTRLPESFGADWMVVTTVVDDPRYLNEPFITSTHFKQLPDDRGWNPTPCSAR